MEEKSDFVCRQIEISIRGKHFSFAINECFGN